MTTTNHIAMQLNEQEQEMVNLLREEMNLSSSDEVLKLLLRQEVQRKAVVCPTCGHMARKTDEDVANCNACLSVIALSEGIWDVVQTQKHTETRS